MNTKIMCEDGSTAVQRSQDYDDDLVRPPMSDNEKYLNIESRGTLEYQGGDDKLKRGGQMIVTTVQMMKSILVMQYRKQYNRLEMKEMA